VLSPPTGVKVFEKKMNDPTITESEKYHRTPKTRSDPEPYCPNEKSKTPAKVRVEPSKKVKYEGKGMPKH